ncbi:SusC/RagA family TonB-linked outer membrane protein [Maribellus comscasis]|uniref:SusC/RagA family TonB-linked outer membrane protein n=2 Tax=Maribellus comscasis TaxID=2681766 RepID=A0A6I6JMX7_9BACT|nr:SusC/RagA family TonB-linked outer membrane protein [Maribellus comscasis]
MKKFCTGLFRPLNRNFIKLMLMTKLTMFLTLFCVLQLSATVYSQTRLTVESKNNTVKEVLSKIENQSEFRFFYNEKFMDLNRRVGFNINNQSIHEIMNELFDASEVTYKIMENNLIVITPDGSQQEKVEGKALDDTGQPLPGVTVMVKGTSQGTVTDVNGSFSFSDLPENATLIFSFVGMISQEIEVGNQTTLSVTMKTDAIGIEEVVAIGYGTQRKENVTGSMETASSEQLENKPIISVGQALQGEMSGISIRQSDGQPGSSTSINIRGFGTFSDAGNNPLVLVDGIPGSLDAVNPNDIKNISVLKDAASAAIYGSRAANGVILIQTKRGTKGKTEVTYNGSVGFSELADLPKFVDSWNYALAYNEALTNAGQGAIYTEEDIQKFRDGTDHDNYPNDKHYEMAFDNIAYQTKHDISLMGGNSTTTYRFSVGYLRNDGLLQNNLYDNYGDNLLNYYNKYNIRLNIDSEITQKLKLIANIAGTADDEKGPAAATGDRTTMRVVTRIARMPASIAGRTSEGYYGRVDKGSPWADIDATSNELERNYYFIANTDLEYKLLDPLTIIVRGGYVFDHTNYKLYAADEQIDATTYAGPAKLDVEWNTRRELTLEGLVKYEQNFGNHSISALAGYSQIESKYEYLTAYRDQFPTNELFELDAGSSENQKNTGGASEWGLVSYFGRIQYDYLGKYLFEANVRYDGSSRFDKGNKYGMFPSFSFGWRISEENFIKESLPWIYNMKLRGSWGELGNQQIGNYPYQAILSSGNNAIWGNNVNAGIVLNTVANQSITWETTAISDIGLDFAVLDGKVSISADYYDKTTRDILYSITTAGTLGLNASPSNAGKVKNSGWDFNLSYKEKFGDFSFDIAPHFSFVHTEVLELSDVEKDISKGLFIGEPLNAIYGYTADGLFVDEADIQNSATQPYDPVPGDIKYKDISGPDGVPDGKVDPEYDRSVIGQTAPKYNYGARISANYKSFDFSVTFDGAGGMRRYLNNMAGRAFANKSNVQQWMWDNRWTKEDPDPNAIYPRFYLHGGGNNEPYSYISTYWAWDASYLKVRSAQIGYNMPEAVTNALKVDKMRIYLAGRNLFTFDNFFDGWDPELNVQTGEGVHYPMSRTYILGVNVNF